MTHQSSNAVTPQCQCFSLLAPNSATDHFSTLWKSNGSEQWKSRDKVKIILAIGAVLLLPATDLVVVVLYGLARCAEAQDETRDD